MINIDFGIAFDRGGGLPLPEKVPFRLTRDIEAGGFWGKGEVIKKGWDDKAHWTSLDLSRIVCLHNFDGDFVISGYVCL